MSDKREDAAKPGIPTGVIIATVTALAGLLGTGIGAAVQGYNETRLEQQKFESELILKALEAESATEQAKSLRFLAEAGLLQRVSAERVARLAEDPDALPSSRAAAITTSGLRNVPTGDGSVHGQLGFEQDAWDAHRTGPLFAISRDYGQGRVVAFTHDDIFRLDGNRPARQRAFEWLWHDASAPVVAFLTNRCTWFPDIDQAHGNAMIAELQGEQVEVRRIDGTLSSASLTGVDVLVVGNAWGNIAPAEVEAVTDYVTQGGGLFTVGLTWSWKAYNHEGNHCRVPALRAGQIPQDLSTYPMNRLVAPFEMSFLEAILER